MASKALITDVVNQGIKLEFANSEIARKNLANARNLVAKRLQNDPTLLTERRLGPILNEYLDSLDVKIAAEVGTSQAFSLGQNDGKTFVGDSARVPKDSDFWGWTPSIPINAISFADDEFATLIRKTTDELKEKTLRAVQVGIVAGMDIGTIQDQILGVGIRGLKGRDGIWRSATTRAEVQARTITNSLINRGAMSTYGQVDQIVPELDVKKLWQTVSDNRTSDRCVSLNGQIKELRENFLAGDGWQGANPPSHPNCRSRVTATTKRYESKWDDRFKSQTNPPKVSAALPIKVDQKLNPRGIKTTQINPTINGIKKENVFSVDSNFDSETWNSWLETINKEDPELGKRIGKVVDFQNKKNIKLVSHNGNNTHMINATKELSKYTKMDSELLVKMLMDLNENTRGVSTELSNIVVVRANRNKAPNLISAKDYKNELKITIAKKRSQLNDYDNPIGPVFRDTAHYELNNFTYNSSRDEQGSNQMLATYVHEMGHQVQYKAMLKKPEIEIAPFSKREWISRYGSDGKRETFAEGFVWFTLDPNSMREISPDYYNWVSEAWRLAND